MPLLISGIRTGLCETEQDVIDHAIHLLGSEQGMVRSASLNKPVAGCAQEGSYYLGQQCPAGT